MNNNSDKHQNKLIMKHRGEKNNSSNNSNNDKDQNAHEQKRRTKNDGDVRKNKMVKAHMAHVSQKNLEFHKTKIRTLSKVKVIQCNMILKVWPTGYLLFKFHNAITNKKCQDIVKKKMVTNNDRDGTFPYLNGNPYSGLPVS